MSRIGKNPVFIPKNVICNISSKRFFEAKGKLGNLSLHIPLGLDVTINKDLIFVKPNILSKNVSMTWGTTRSLISNIIKGVSDGFVKVLEINGVGYKASVNSSHLVLNLGYSHEILYLIPDGIKLVCKKPTLIEIHGINRQLVGQVASKIRSFRKPEPYKGKGIKYLDEIIFRKEGKKK